MLEFYEPGAAIIEDSIARAVERVKNNNKRVLGFMFDAQKMLLDEMVFTGNEAFDRTRTEMHLLSELASKMAGSHSVEGFRATGMECAQHQIDFIRRDCERVFKHGERMIEATANLIGSRSQA